MFFWRASNGCLEFCRQSTPSTRWACTAWRWCHPTICPRPHWAESTCQKLSGASLRALCIQPTCCSAPTLASPTYRSRARSTQVRNMCRSKYTTRVQICGFACSWEAGKTRGCQTELNFLWDNWIWADHLVTFSFPAFTECQIWDSLLDNIHPTIWLTPQSSFRIARITHFCFPFLACFWF